MSAPEEEEEERGFVSRHRVAVGIAAIAVLGAAGYYAWSQKPAPRKKVAEVRMVDLLPPPPPPPPTPPQEPPPEPPEPQETTQPEFEPEEAPQEAPPEEPPAEEPPLGTNIAGEGPGDSFGLAAGGGMGVIGGKGKGGGQGGTKFGWYAAQVQTRVAEALRAHPRTRSAQMTLTVRVWADATGRITRVSLGDTSGNAEVDQALQNEILTGLQLRQAPPADMPMPIVMRISAKRPN